MRRLIKPIALIVIAAIQNGCGSKSKCSDNECEYGECNEITNTCFCDNAMLEGDASVSGGSSALGYTLQCWCNGNYTGSDISPEYDVLWSTGETTREITVFQSGTYSVRMTDPKGCVLELEVSVTSNPTVQDIEGNTYDLISIGSQTWIGQNMRTSKYRNGDDIVLAQDDNSWVSNDEVGKRCFYNEVYLSNVGYLYNFFAVNDPRGICPNGFHVPSMAEWQELAQHENGMLRGDRPQFIWQTSGGSGVFRALAGGDRSGSTGYYGWAGSRASFWSNETSTSPWNGRFFLLYDPFSGYSLTESSDKRMGASCRCIQD